MSIVLEATSAVSSMVVVAAATTETPAVETITNLVTATAEMEKEEDEEGKVKEFPFSKQEGVVLESENKFFLARREDDPKLLGEEVRWLFFTETISFGGRRTKVGGLNLMMASIFLLRIIVSLFNLTWLVLVVIIPHHGL